MYMCLYPAASVAVVDRDKGKMRQCQFCHKSFTAPVFRNHKVGKDGIQRQD